MKNLRDEVDDGSRRSTEPSTGWQSNLLLPHDPRRGKFRSVRGIRVDCRTGIPGKSPRDDRVTDKAVARSRTASALSLSPNLIKTARLGFHRGWIWEACILRCDRQCPLKSVRFSLNAAEFLFHVFNTCHHRESGTGLEGRGGEDQQDVRLIFRGLCKKPESKASRRVRSPRSNF